MYSKIYWLHSFPSGSKLGIMARPRGNDWLDQEIGQLKKHGIAVMVSLLESQEITELGLLKQQEICAAHGIEYINFPIIDRGLPTSIDKVKTLIENLKEQLNNERSVVIHCRMGIGRSSTIAGCVLLRTGYKPNDIFAHISKMRGLRVPDTEEQAKWLTHVFNR
jgi:protein-tyrosine phosphatase